MSESGSNQILFLAPKLLGESLALQLTRAERNLEVFLDSNYLTKHPSLIIWSLEDLEVPYSIKVELRRLESQWDNNLSVCVQETLEGKTILYKFMII